MRAAAGGPAIAANTVESPAANTQLGVASASTRISADETFAVQEKVRVRNDSGDRNKLFVQPREVRRQRDQVTRLSPLARDHAPCLVQSCQRHKLGHIRAHVTHGAHHETSQPTERLQKLLNRTTVTLSENRPRDAPCSSSTAA